MKSQTLYHPKFRRLHKMLGSESTAHTAGYLDLLWIDSYQAECGPIYRRNKIESTCDWQGEPGVLLAALIACEWLDEVDDDLVEVHDFHVHAPNYVRRRASRAEYMRRYRAKKEDVTDSNELRNTPVTSHVTDCNELRNQSRNCPNQTQPNQTKPNLTNIIQYSGDKETEISKNKRVEQVKEILAAWDSLAKKTGLPKIARLSDKRKAAINTRLQDKFFVEHWREAMDAIPASAFLMGQNDRGWAANIDWFLRPDTVSGILEGKYHKKNSTGLPERAGDNPTSGDFKLF